MMIQCKLQPHPKDGSQLIWKSHNSSFESIFAKEKYFCQAQYNFGFSKHSDRRIVDGYVVCVDVIVVVVFNCFFSDVCYETFFPSLISSYKSLVEKQSLQKLKSVSDFPFC